MIHINDFLEHTTYTRETVIKHIKKGKIKGFSWHGIWFILEHHEDYPPTSITIYPKEIKQTNVGALERRIEELEVAVLELQATTTGRGYHLSKPIVGRHPYEDRYRRDTANRFENLKKGSVAASGHNEEYLRLVEGSELDPRKAEKEC